ncbi:MAG: hypothetical protein ABI432_03420 [Flavobacteriales bacterium]
MTRRTFMLAMAWFHMLFGVFFLFFNVFATNLILRDPGPTSPLLVKGLSGIVFAFGLLNYMARDSADSKALRAVLVCTAFYLLFTIAFDVYWTLTGLLHPVAWYSIGIRAVFACGYLYHISRHRTPTS